MIFCLLTGATRGIGRAIATAMDKHFGKDVSWVLVARNSEMLDTTRKNLKGKTEILATDLSLPVQAGRAIASLLSNSNPGEYERLILINNAGVLPPAGKTGTLNNKEIEQNIQTNLAAPLILSNVFLHWAGTAPQPKLILNISSGAGRFPIISWGAYCASKAGLDMFSKVIAEEKRTDLQVISAAPGIIETDMQKIIRTLTPDQFPPVENFIAYKSSGVLKSPENAAKEILNIVKNPDSFKVITSL